MIKVSRTALATSLMRAAHTRLDPNPLIDDPWGDRLVPESLREDFRHTALARMDPAGREQALASPHDIVDESMLRSRPYANVIMRTRYTEDALRAAVTRGATQYILVGAGFDSFALRRPDFAANLEIFEIDHPATQQFKQARINELGLSLPSTVHFVATDLSAESVAGALARTGYRADRLSFFSWLGVTMYLSRESNTATLESIASCAARGSELAFTYLDEKIFNLESESFQRMQRSVTALGEPFLSGFDPFTLPRYLASCGLALCEDLIGDQVLERYGRDAVRSPDHSSYSHMALARVGA